ncbi:MAG: calcium-binding protein [Lyngbya sp.]|nr:calcium-binding protein [Lyngbya sp.]
MLVEPGRLISDDGNPHPQFLTGWGECQPQAFVRFFEDFNDSGVLDSWTVVDEGEPDLEGNEPEAADWQIENGALVQNNSVFSRQLSGGGDASPEEPWNSNWSPHGDGWRALRKGTFAFYEDAEAENWRDYSVETNVFTPDDGGVGILFYYQDENNYYKLEIDAEERFVQLFKLVDGVETTIARTRDRYTSGEEFNLRVDIQDQEIQADLNGEAVFAYPYEDRDLTGGTFGLYTWNSEGVRFEDLTVLDLSEELPSGSEGVELEGTDEDDLLVGTPGEDTIAGLSGNDEIDGLGGDDVLRGDLNERSPGTSEGGDDTINGGTGDDHIGGKGGNDQLYGDAGNDSIWGDDGDDLIRGGLGDDTLTGDDFSGGRGSDTFILAVGEGTDTIADFEAGVDFIGLEGLTFADLTFTGNSILFNGETLATLNGIDTTTLTEDDFTAIL